MKNHNLFLSLNYPSTDYTTCHCQTEHYIAKYMPFKGWNAVKICTFAKFPRPATSRNSCGHNGEMKSKAVPKS
jgi:hypothetical protein